MADNISIKDGAAATVVIAAKDVSSVFVPASTPVTPANVTMVGTAGSAAAGVMTVQGIASGTVLPTTSTDLTILLTSLAPTSVAFTPAASSHTAGDSVGGAGTFTTVGASGKQVMICGARLVVSSATVPASAFTLWLFNAAPTVVADDAAFGVLVADVAKYLGKIPLGTPVLSGVSGTATISDVSQNGLAISVPLTTANIVAYLTNDTTVTTVAQAHTVTLLTYPLS